MAENKKDDEKKGLLDRLEEKIFPHERKREQEEQQQKERAEAEAEQARKARIAQREVDAKAEKARQDRERAQAEQRQQPGGSGFGSEAAQPSTGGATSRRMHTVKSGETLSHIALKYYGSATKEHWMKIYEANKATIGDNPNIIRTGQELVIP
jgi:nucleoid-associated protein YgaU